MRYYKISDENGKLVAIGIGYDGEEITEEEYNALMTEIQEKTAYIFKLADGEITAEDVPEEWREEVQAAAEAIIKAREEAENQEPIPQHISADEALNILLGGEDA
ncbi:MAG: hypothetical protein J6S14_08875 [Clostridia bacterium]|nr:hypothetical protein [Clostridia bacterium]